MSIYSAQPYFTDHPRKRNAICADMTNNHVPWLYIYTYTKRILFVLICGDTVKNTINLKAAVDRLFYISKYLKLKLIFEKTQAIRIGSKSESSDILCPSFKIHYTNDDFNVLGIQFN